MKTISTILFLSTVAVAEIPYFSKLGGTTFSNILSRETFSFSGGELGQCERKVFPESIFYQCPVKGALATATDPSGNTKTFTFHTVKMSFRGFEKRREYYLLGNYVEEIAGTRISSPTRLTLWYREANPERIRGFITLEEYSITSSIEARPE